METTVYQSLHNEELYSLYRSPNIVRVIMSRRLRWAGYVASISIFAYSSLYLLLFLKSSRICVVLIPTPFIPSFLLQWHHEGGNFFSEYDQCNWLLFRTVFFSPIRSRTCSLVTFSGHYIFSILLQHRISRLTKYFSSNNLSVQVSELYNAMLQT